MKNKPFTEAQNEDYVSRGGLKLSSVADKLGINFEGKVILDVGSSTGGFSDYCLKHGATFVIAVEVGVNQMDPGLRLNPKIELHEKTDIRDVSSLSRNIDICLIDVSFIKLEMILPSVRNLIEPNVQILALFKPQFEATPNQKNKGVIKNNTVRRELTKQFEKWSIDHGFIVVKKADSAIFGRKGNKERFYLLSIV